MNIQKIEPFYNINAITKEHMRILLCALQDYLETVENSYQPQSMDDWGREELKQTRVIIRAILASNSELAEHLTLLPSQLAEPGDA